MDKQVTILLNFITIFLITIAFNACSIGTAKDTAQNEYGVFVGIDDSKIAELEDYKTVVIDAEYFSKEDITELKANGKIVYSYINLGSLENFRDYYDEYLELTLGDYEGWPEEKWVDVSSEAWKEHILKLAEEYKEKGVDGYFIDNCDVYYVYPEEETYKGIVDILREISYYDKKVIVNGGDAFVLRYLAENERVEDILTGINQESVFTCDDTDTSKYYQEYLATCKEYGAEIYVLEYTTDERMIQEIQAFCEDKGYKYFIADSMCDS